MIVMRATLLYTVIYAHVLDLTITIQRKTYIQSLTKTYHSSIRHTHSMYQPSNPTKHHQGCSSQKHSSSFPCSGSQSTHIHSSASSILKIHGELTSYLGSSSLASTFRPAWLPGSVRMDWIVPMLSEVRESGPSQLTVSIWKGKGLERVLYFVLWSVVCVYLRRACSARLGRCGIGAFGWLFM